jgi:hypothetical protein
VVAVDRPRQPTHRSHLGARNPRECRELLAGGRAHAKLILAAKYERRTGRGTRYTPAPLPVVSTVRSSTARVVRPSESMTSTAAPEIGIPPALTIGSDESKDVSGTFAAPTSVRSRSTT